MAKTKQKTILKISFNSPVVLGFALICLGAYLLNCLTSGRSNILLFEVYRAPLTDPLPAAELTRDIVSAVDGVQGEQAWVALRVRYRRHLARLAAWVRGRPGDVNEVLPYDEVVSALGFRSERPLGLQVVPVARIVGIH